LDTLFSNITVVTMDEENSVLLDAFVGVTDGKIAYVGRKAPQEHPKQIIDGTGMVLMPGLVNCHTHLPMSILRGYADDYDLQTWLNDHIFPREDKLDGRAVKAATLLGIAECLRFGITSVSDMYYFCDEMCQAVAESGIKANISRGTTYFVDETEEFDPEQFVPYQEMVALHEAWHGFDQGRIKIEVSIHGEYTSNYKLWEHLAEYAINNDLGMHIHLSETKAEHESCLDRYGLTPAQVLDCHAVLKPRVTAAHCVWCDDSDLDLLARREVSVVHNPISNMKLASGIAPVTKMLDRGINVALGTDGMASNNNSDLFEEIKTAALLAKVSTQDPTALSAPQVLRMATVNGALCQGREEECGQIKVGMDADLIMLDFTQPHLIPCHNVLSHLAYSASGHDVCMTMVRGKILYAAGKYPTIDMNAVIKELSSYAMPKVFRDDD
jgi:5-methylthioadenosine/S-adenosylhomocysteine deaminase